MTRAILLMTAALALSDAPAVTIHRSFSSRVVGFGGGASVGVPVDSKVAAALDEAREKEAERVKVYVGRVTSVSAGDKIRLVTGGGTLVPVRLDLIEAPKPGQPHGKESAAFLKKLIQGRQVRVEYRKRDEQGYVLGTVTLNKKDVNLQMLAAGMARYCGDIGMTSAYVEAESAARDGKKGLWADEAKEN